MVPMGHGAPPFLPRASASVGWLPCERASHWLCPAPALLEGVRGSDRRGARCQGPWLREWPCQGGGPCCSHRGCVWRGWPGHGVWGWGRRFRLTPGGGGGGLPAGDIWEGERRGVWAQRAPRLGCMLPPCPALSGPRIARPPREAPGDGPSQIQPPHFTCGRSTPPWPASLGAIQGSPPTSRLQAQAARMGRLGTALRACGSSMTRPAVAWGRSLQGSWGGAIGAGPGRGPGRTLAPVHPPQCTGGPQMAPRPPGPQFPPPPSLCLQGR